MQTWTSWNGLVQHSCNRVVRPRTEHELQAAIAESRSVRVVGAGYSSADIAAGSQTIIDLTSGYAGIVDVDSERRRLQVQAGMTLRGLAAILAEHGWTLPALPDIDLVTVGGAIATGTHGTGREAHLLSQSVVAMRLVRPDGTVLEVTSGDEHLDAFRLSLGVLGAISTVTLQAEPQFRMRVHGEPVRDAVWLRRWSRWLDEHEFLRVLWLPHTGYAYVYRGDRVEGAGPPVARVPSWVRQRRRVSTGLYTVVSPAPRLIPSVNRSLQRLFFGHREMLEGSLYEATVTTSARSPMELAEWTVPRESFTTAFRELAQTIGRRPAAANVHMPMDVRFLRADSTWLSCAYGRDSVTVGCVCRTVTTADRYPAFDLVERVLGRHEGRPHWAKRHTWGAPQMARAWPRFTDFGALRQQLDPQGHFLTPALRRLLGVPLDPPTLPRQRRITAIPRRAARVDGGSR